MSTWNFDHEQNTDGKGANTYAGRIAGNQPYYNADALPSKRNIIATELGWVRRISYTDTHGNERTKDEVVVAAHPGGLLGEQGGYANSVYLGPPDVGTLQLSTNTATGTSTFANTVDMQVVVTFNEPLNTANTLSITATGINGGATFTLYSNTETFPAGVAVFDTYGGNNAVVFTGTPAVGPDDYVFDTQTIVTAGAPFSLTSRNADAEVANTVVTAAVSNTLMDFAGNILANGQFTIV